MPWQSKGQYSMIKPQKRKTLQILQTGMQTPAVLLQLSTKNVQGEDIISKFYLSGWEQTLYMVFIPVQRDKIIAGAGKI